MSKNTESAIDHRTVKALAHPLRYQLLIKLNQRVASPSELAEELGEPLGNVSYHTRILAELGCIELVKTTPRRGALEHHYRAIMRPFFSDDDWAQLPVSARRSISASLLEQIWRDVGRAAESGGFDHPDAHVSWTTLRLDEQAWSEVRGMLGEAVERALELQAAAASRTVKGPDAEHGLLESELAIMHFLLPGTGDVKSG